MNVMFYRFCRIYHLGIRPVFVFDGEGRPNMKRKQFVNTRIPDTIAMRKLKSLIKLFGFAEWLAYGEAEAECAVLQRLGYVDLVMTGDVDVFLFGARRVLRHWPSKDGFPCGCYDTSWFNLDRSDLILIAILRGSDYQDGIKGIGIKLAEGLARAKHHTLLMQAMQNDKTLSFDDPRVNALFESLACEIRTNKSGHLSRTYKNIDLSPSPEHFWILKEFINPTTRIENKDFVVQAHKLKEFLDRDQAPSPDFGSLGPYCRENFEWSQKVVLTRFKAKLYPAYILHKVRLKAWKAVTPSRSFKKKHPLRTQQTTVDTFYRSTKDYRNAENDQAIIARIWQHKIVMDRKFYRVQWHDTALDQFLAPIRTKLKAVENFYLQNDFGTNAFHPNENEDDFSPACRQWVESSILSTAYPDIVEAYEIKSQSKPTKKIASQDVYIIDDDPF
ncbi:PIN domain-like protein [Phycomyces blakesleeanus]|uniref:PIN domain-like protein n=2 Tax=Phycomyces blakesleeanus TaxID=4837 RepID=A0ABR3BH55_PHYBL